MDSAEQGGRPWRTHRSVHSLRRFLQRGADHPRWREEIDGLHQREPFAQQIDAGVVIRVESDRERWVALPRQFAQHRIERRRIEFCRAAAAFAIEVSFTDEAKSHLAVNRFDYSEVRRFVLAHPWKTVVG